MKKDKIIFWLTTGIIFVFEGVMPALTSQSKLAKEGISHLGYPEYFGTMLMIFKVLGALALIIPKVPDRIKEWAYGGFIIEFICASASTWIVDSFGFPAIFPLIVLAILLVSYIYYHKINAGAKMI